jgi:allantoinase
MALKEFPCVNETDLKLAMNKLQSSATVLAFHAELETDPAPSTSGNPTHYATFLSSRPQSLETAAISLITRLQTSYPALRCHIVHLSASSALPLVRAAKAAGARLTAETCFHYLAFDAEDIPDGRPEFKCCPPVRERINRDLLWEALKDGTIDMVVSDHSPCVADLKKCEDGDIMNAWGGISTLGLGLSVLWTEGKKRGVGIGKIVEWTAGATARHVSLDSRKGKIATGYDADLVIWNPEGELKVRTLSSH